MTASEQPVRFEILGSVRALRGDDELDLGPVKQRAVLAVLLLDPGRAVSTPRIVDAVWQGDPPENDANAVQKYIAGLRRVLEPSRSPRTPGQLLVRTDAGYQLAVAPGCLDAEAFKTRVRQAQRVRAEGRAAEAAAQLLDALALWRGEALAGLTGPTFHAARDRLAEGRAAALETWAEIELELGHHADLVPELVRAVTDHPLRERSRELLMLALYRCGRQAEALAVFREARRYLVEELGVEPGEQLRKLHQRVLESDPELLAPTGGAPSSESPPDDLPPASARVWPAVERYDPGTEPGDQPGERSRPWLRRLLAGAVPCLSLGMLTWVVFAYLADRRHSRLQALVAVGYFLAFGAFFMILVTSPEDEFRWVDAAAVMLWFGAWAGGTGHAALAAGADRRIEPRQALRRHRSLDRDQARRLAEQHPEVAHYLNIGRPDLPRPFDDGGLVDLNGAPEHVLAAVPAIGARLARRIVADRRGRGGYTSIDDLITRNLLPAPLDPSLRSILVVVTPPWDPTPH